jgi:hypothetical protein
VYGSGYGRGAGPGTSAGVCFSLMG